MGVKLSRATLSLEKTAELLISVAAKTKGAFIEEAYRFIPLENTREDGKGKYSDIWIHFFSDQKDKKGNEELLAMMNSWLKDHQEEAFRDQPQEWQPIEGQPLWKIENFWSYALFYLGDPVLSKHLPDQFLAIKPIHNAEELSELVHQLALNATYTRVAVSQDLDGVQFAFFHIKDDPERDSSLQSLIASRMYPDLCQFDEYNDGPSSIFLQQNLKQNGNPLQPGRLGLKLLCRFLNAASRLWSKDFEKPASNGLLAAFLRDNLDVSDTEKNWHILDLRSLHFQNQSQLVFRADEFAHVKVVRLENAPEYNGDFLRAAIQQATPPSGYSLKLRHTHLRLHYTQPIDRIESEREIEEIESQINNLEYRRALLASASERKPLLLRFSQWQLPALADYLSTLSPMRLAGESLRYAFQSTEDNPSGYHYLLIPPEILAEADITPLYSWPNFEEKRVFWMDPLWARYYPGSAERSYLFVPFEMALFPPMHNWDDNEMADYLKKVIQEWSNQEDQNEKVPEQPIYVFDLVETRGEEGGLDQKIHILVLDEVSFRPINVNLPWINDCLVLHQELTTEPTISALASAKSQEKLVESAMNREADMLRKVKQTADRIQKQIEEILTELAQAFVSQYTMLNEETNATANKASQLNNRLQATIKEYQTLSEYLAQVENNRSQIRSEAAEKIGEAGKVQEMVSQAAQIQAVMTQAATDSIQKLQAEEYTQRQRLKNIRFRSKQ